LSLRSDNLDSVGVVRDRLKDSGIAISLEDVDLDIRPDWPVFRINGYRVFLEAEGQRLRDADGIRGATAQIVTA